MQPLEITLPAFDAHGQEHPALLLSAPTLADVPRITEICQDQEIQRWTTVPSPYNRSDAEYFVTNVVVPGWDSGTLLTWGIRLRDDADAPYVSEPISAEAAPVEAGQSSDRCKHDSPDGTLVGMFAIDIATPGSGEVGYWLAPQARGRGILDRVFRHLVDLSFDSAGPLGLRRLSWTCSIINGVPNWASWRAAWRVGFIREGHRRASTERNGVVMDQWVGSLLADDPRQPRLPWDGPTPACAEPLGHGHGSAHTQGQSTPLIMLDDLGRRQGDDPEALVRRFHRVYGLPIRTDGPSLERASLGMRMSLIAEEFAELTGAVYGSEARNVIEQAVAQAVAADDGMRDTVETADALADLIYVIYGMALEMGIDIAAVLAEVQRSNMSKLGADGQPIYREDGKVLKGPDYFPPDIAGVLGLS